MAGQAGTGLSPLQDGQVDEETYRGIWRSDFQHKTCQIKPISNQRLANIWDAIEDTPKEAENMTLLSALMTALKTA